MEHTAAPACHALPPPHSSRCSENEEWKKKSQTRKKSYGPKKHMENNWQVFLEAWRNEESFENLSNKYTHVT